MLRACFLFGLDKRPLEPAFGLNLPDRTWISLRSPIKSPVENRLNDILLARDSARGAFWSFGSALFPSLRE